MVQDILKQVLCKSSLTKLTWQFFNDIFIFKEFMQGYPRIKGPKSVHDRIAIIGAGPSGLHMAYELKVHNLLLYYNCTTLNKSFKCSPNIMYWICEINTFVCLAVTLSEFHLTLKWLRRCSDLKIWLWDETLPYVECHEHFRLVEFSS